MKMTPEMHTEVIDFITSTTMEQQLFFIQCIADRISVNTINSKGNYSCDNIDDPFAQINLNGMLIDITLIKEM